MMDNGELMKLFDFILENKDMIFVNGLFSLDTLAMIRAIVRGRIPNNFKLTKEQQQLIIDAFIGRENAFNEDTPVFIMENPECVKIAIEKDINSIDYMQTVDSEIESYVIEKALKKDFILKKYSPEFLKDNFSIALNSIKLDVKTADYVDWYSFSDMEASLLVDEVIKSGYTLSWSSHEFLTNNLKIVLDSIKKDKDNVKFVSADMQHAPDVFKYLILNDYSFSVGYIKNRTLNYFLDKDVLVESFRRISVYNYCDDEKYFERFNKLFSDGINSRPLIKTFDSVFYYVAEQRWREHRKQNFDYYDNIFGKICSELRNSDDFNIAIGNLKFINKMKEMLGDKYSLLYQSMREYFDIYHSRIDNKLEKIETSKDMIANLSALYVAKCKENYKKERLHELHDYIKDYFTLRLDNSYVNKKLIQSHQKKQFKDAYRNRDGSVCDFVNKVCQTYNKVLDDRTVRNFIYGFIFNNHSKLNEIILEPYRYSDYVRYEKAIKLIHRLNSGYIKYGGVEVLNYKDIISFDKEKKCYVYTGINFTESNLKEYNEYKKKIQIFDKIKKDIMMKVKTMEFDGKIDDDLASKLAKELPFTDEYFKFDNEWTLEYFNLWDLIDSCIDPIRNYELNSLVCDDSFSNIYNMMVNNGLMWLLVFIRNQRNLTLSSHSVDKDNVIEIINNMDTITRYAKDFNFDLNDFGEILLAYDISQCASDEALAILGKEIIEKLYKFTDYTDNEAQEIIYMAKELICEMAKRSKSTVPYVNGKHLNYNYSMYDSQDETILLSGINTDSCFRIDGNDNDFLHYCALDKNGFVIKITDDFGNFIARASGFRNGNCVYINQLRTIYDEGGNNYYGEYDNEKNDIIETFKKACQDIVTTSQNNIMEINKIDFVFVTQSYALDDYESNVGDEVSDEIGYTPMDTTSEDWIEFVDNTNNLQEADEEGYFTTDYGDYPLICMASSMEISEILPEHIERENVPALYERKRNKIIVTNKIDINVCQKINKIKAIDAFFRETEYDVEEIPATSTVFIGDNWYIIYNNGDIVSSCLLVFDSKAKIEFEATKQVINQYTMNNNKQQLDVEKMLSGLQMQETDRYTKILKPR